MKCTVFIVFALKIISFSVCFSQVENPCKVKHDVGRIVLYRGLDPLIGGNNYVRNIDCMTGSESSVGSCIYPKGSSSTYLGYCYVMIGGIYRGDTLVSGEDLLPIYGFEPGSTTPWEFHSHIFPFYEVQARSTSNADLPGNKNAISEQDYISITTDTVTEGVGIFKDYFHLRPHIPMGIEVINRSYAWSVGYAEDIVFFDWTIKNIGNYSINNAYIGLTMYSNTGYLGSDAQGRADDIAGFLKNVISPVGCSFRDSVALMWVADNDGDPVGSQFVNQPTLDPSTGDYVISCKDVVGVELIDAPKDLVPGSTVSYNWWRSWAGNQALDFGPRNKHNFRDFRTGGLGTPYGDVNQYYLLGNGEVDYDQIYTYSISRYDETWMYPDQSIAADVSDGTSMSQLLSIGPVDISPGGEFPIVFAFLAGESFHKDPQNIGHLPYEPDLYYANLDFSDLIQNAQWARYIYDNPGVDTDGDGYSGEFRICVLDSVLDVDSIWIPSVAETTFYKGDGVPDWRVALPPPSPKVWVTPTFRGIHIRFNGSESETSRDIFTRLKDFEGYRVYLSRDERKTSYSLLASYDIENYDKYIWNEQKQPDPGWEILDFPSTIEEIRCAYASGCDDSTFDPLYYRPSQPFVHPQYPESLFYWVKHDWNVSEFGVTSDIKKIYPNARDPRTVPADSLTPVDYTDDGYLKYFEYEYDIDNLLPTVTYFVSVTAFDFGWPKSRLEPLETSITDNAQQVYASVIDSAFNGNYKSVVVYPNPYRIDEEYRQRGYEGLGDDLRSNERVRRIHFANLPAKCTIKIFSLDGDLVREIHHDKDPSDPTSSHEEWGLISKNGLAVVSGLYYWTVESEDGTVQMGKLAIIL